MFIIERHSECERYLHRRVMKMLEARTVSDFEVEREAKHLADCLRGYLRTCDISLVADRLTPELDALLTRCRDAAVQETEEAHAGVFCQKCAKGERPTHSPDDYRWLFMHGDRGCTGDWVWERRRRRERDESNNLV